MVPAFREAVEECFVEGLAKVVFATETLPLGNNIPARTLVPDKLTNAYGDPPEPPAPRRAIPSQQFEIHGSRSADRRVTNIASP